MDEMEKHKMQAEAVKKFIALANELKGDKFPVDVVSDAMLSAAGVYATYVAAGNDGFLRRSGVEKVITVFANSLMAVQEAKRKELEAKGVYKSEDDLSSDAE